MPFCAHGLHYNLTHMPNLLGHSSQDEAAQAGESWLSSAALDFNCDPKFRPFLCAFFAPECKVDGDNTEVIK